MPDNCHECTVGSRKKLSKSNIHKESQDTIIKKSFYSKKGK